MFHDNDETLDEETPNLLAGKARECLVHEANRSPDPHVRAFSLYILGKLKDPEFLPNLLSGIRDGDKSVRAQAASALAGMGDAAVVPLLDALGDSDWKVRYRAAEALGRMNTSNRDVSGSLIQSLHDDKDHVRYMAAKSLGSTGGQEAVIHLAERLTDGNEFVRRIAAISLGRIGGERAINALSQACSSEKDPAVRRAILKALEGREK